MSYDFVIELQLKQVTPMIHFQHDSKGATLRATEVKPKLDRYIVGKLVAQRMAVDSSLTEDEAKKQVYDDLRTEGLLVGKSDALNYRMSIEATGTPDKSNEIDIECDVADYFAANGNVPRNVALDSIDYEKKFINKFYFGNMVNRSTDTVQYKKAVSQAYKETVFYKDDIILKIICFDGDLRRLISENLINFFLNTNFGCRQTKGFGCFVPTKLNGKDICRFNGVKDIMQHIDGDNYFWFDAGTTDQKKLLEHAWTVYSVMKAGLNGTGLKQDRNTRICSYRNPEAYIRGFSMGDFLGQTGSEKAKIKKFLFRRPYDLSFVNGQSNQEASYEYKEYNFIRAVLGLADNYDFKDAPRGRTAKIQIYHYPDNDSAMIQRFPSPVTIKIIDKYVFFIIDNSYKRLLNKTFLLLKVDNRDNCAKQIKKDLDEIKKKGDSTKAREYMDTLLGGNNRSIITTIKTPVSFDVTVFIERFSSYFNSETTQAKLGKFRDTVISDTAGIKLNIGKKGGQA